MAFYWDSHRILMKSCWASDGILMGFYRVFFMRSFFLDFMGFTSFFVM